MTMTVDVVVVGTTQRALGAAVEQAQRGHRVLVMTSRRDPELRRHIRRARAAAGDLSPRITVLTGVEVECVAGIRAVEAVLARYVRTGRRVDVNATSVLAFDDETETTVEQKQGAVRW